MGVRSNWQVQEMGKVFDISGGFSASRDQLSHNGHCYLHYGDIHTSNRNYIDVKTDFLNIPKLEIPLSKINNKALLKDGDVVFVDASEDDEGVSRHVVIKNPEGLPFISGLHTIVAKPKNDLLINSFKKYCFQTKYVKDQFKFFAVGTKVSGISKSNIVKIKIEIPNSVEQEAIANALTNADAYVESLEKLIEKKRLIKIGVMQELLSGKRRLPGFNEDWEERKLGEFLDYIQPTPYLVASADYGDNYDTPVLTAGKTFILGYTNENNGIFRDVPVIIFDDFTTDVKYVDFPFKAKSSAMKILIRKNANVNLKLIYEIMKQIDFPLGDHKRHWIGEFQHLKIFLPKSQDEQSAISKILSEIELEIKNLTLKLTKARQIKQAMMQELLTGRIRLV